MEQVNEKSTAYLTVSFYDKDSVLAQPTSATYRVDTEAGEAIRTSTALTPVGGQVEITLLASDNAIITTNAVREIHVVTVSAVYGSDDELHDAYRYEVVNLAQVT